jgi:hypothetical protein
MKKYRALAAWLVATLPGVMMACGDDGDDDAPADTGGAGGTGAKGGSGGQGGSSPQGGNSGEGGTNSTGGTSGMAGEGPGGAGGEATGGSSTGGSSTGGSSGNGGCDLSGEDLPHEEIPANIDDEFTLTTGTVWELNGNVKVHDGGVLNIEACTRIEGSPGPSPGVLFVLRGGQIQAVGTADEPILFTSASPAGARASGQWGGVVLLGRAPIGAATASKVYEGLTDTELSYGGDDEDDDSGQMSYVRIEFGGWAILPDKEINGLSMAAVGSGTTLDHIMVSNSADDCYEWWGGSVRADYLVANNCGDDMFDADEGFLGGGSHWFGRRTGAAVISSMDPNGFEWDGTEGGSATVTRRSEIGVSDVTLCGTGATVSAGGSPEFGMVLRELITGEIDNLSLLGFEYGIDTRDAIQAGDVTLENSLFWSLSGAKGAPDTTNNDSGFVDASIFDDGTGNEEPDPVPFTLDDCQEAAGPTSDVKESDVGAFAGDETWMNGRWVDFSED